MTKTLIFDCDGVLVDSEVICIAMELQFLAKVGLTYRRDDYCQRFMGLPGKAFHAALNEDCLERLGKDLPEDFMARLIKAVKAEWRRNLQPVAGAEAFFAERSETMAVASSTRREFLHWKLNHTGLYDYFTPHLYSAELVTRGKPAPDLFLHAAQALDVAPADCVVIEDSSNGIQAAKAAGMATIGFLGGGHNWPGQEPGLLKAGADHIVANYDELPGVLAREFDL